MVFPLTSDIYIEIYMVPFSKQDTLSENQMIIRYGRNAAGIQKSEIWPHIPHKFGFLFMPRF